MSGSGAGPWLGVGAPPHAPAPACRRGPAHRDLSHPEPPWGHNRACWDGTRDVPTFGGQVFSSCPCPLCSERLQSRTPARCVVPPPCHTEDDDKTWVRTFQFPLDATAQMPGAGPAFSSRSDVVSYPCFGTPRPTQTPGGWSCRHLVPLLPALRPLPPGPLEVDLCSLPSPSLPARPSAACLVGPRHTLHVATAHNTRQGAGWLQSAPESGSGVGVGGRGAWVRV